ncbi:heavy metal translocating P-type ATPase [Actinosynnema mirum]|uniref:Heavy metal translocating P-type ATPase n=1 Tax=Actinosynnema mirum (strain ATCC 29888 / DSM 43827 / JCM 3225 / NBRC 14064 / NCIMB 13271 / NRRL B-12336 / IMRU 3971 / 101) TaxID=446462 RepID=C6WIP8_ACTMD|nr:heavy metal translocating P-type ATPase [Actinosynnema mirum]ACU38138.1 heavy metal translocating P-type ATPase [Actinosynnema mirum DSM 43827]
MTTVAPERPTTRAPARRTRWTALPEARWAAVSLALFLTALAVQLADGPEPVRWALYLACCAAGGWEPGLSGLRALRERTLDVDLLMVVAAIGAVAVGQALDGALLIVIFATSGALEALATARTEDSVRGLLDLAPDTATRVGDGAEEVVRVADLEVGDVVLVRPGELVPADGVVVAGAGEVDQATITGEPLPVDKAEGDEVFAGTLNGTGALRVRVGKRAADSVVARIAAAVEEASRTKARTQLFIEKVEQRYSIGMVVATLVIFTAPLPWGEPVREALLRAMTFMIVASPCALVLATMPPLLAAIANAGRHGVLVKSAVVVERLADADRVAFDKTGTLTRGEPEVAGLRALPGAGLDEDALLRLAASAEHPSEHPLGRAVVRAARERGLDVPQAREFTARPGRGVRARVGDRVVEIGSPEALGGAGIGGAGIGGAGIGAVDGFLTQGHTAVLVLVDGEPAGVLAIADRVRPEAAAAVAALTAATGAGPVLLTGDNRRTADRLAERVGITDVRAGLLPEDKAEAVRALQAEGRRVVVVGDGVNDAPALAVAHAGVAMGAAGADLTLRTADAVVVRDDLSTIPAAIALARRAKRVVVANLVIAGSFIVVLVAWDLLGDLPLPLGVAGHEGSTVIVGLNGLRLLREAAWRKAKAEG